MSVVTSDIVFVPRASYKPEQGAPVTATQPDRSAGGAGTSAGGPGLRTAGTTASSARNTRVKKVRWQSKLQEKVKISMFILLISLYSIISFNSFVYTVLIATSTSFVREHAVRV